MRVARHYIVRGRVQGVGFRYSVREAAAQEGVHGWVRNLPDGAVEIHAQGDVDAMDRFQQFVHEGPRGARVTNVQVKSGVMDGTCAGFAIR